MNTIIRLEDWQAGIISGQPMTSWMGTPVMMPFTFGTVRRETVQDGKRVTLIFPEWTLPGTTIARFNRSKRIVKTEVVGGSSTVKEFIGWTDWSITVSGIITPSGRGDYGYDKSSIERLRLLDEIDASIPVYHAVCEYLGIYEVVVEGIEISEPTGNGQPFVLQLVSDADENLMIG